MTGNPRARKLGEAVSTRASSVSGARPRPTDTQYSSVNRDEPEPESHGAPDTGAPTNAEAAAAAELERRLREQQLELERLRHESVQRIRAAESERDAALAAVEELRASLSSPPVDAFATTSLAPPLGSAPPLVPSPPSPAPSVVVRPANLTPSSPTKPPALPSSAHAASSPPEARPAHTAVPAEPPAPPPDAPSPSRRRERGSVPTLSDVLVATDLGAPDPGAAESDDRRSEPRILRQFEVEFNYETHFFAGLTLDISNGGLFIATYHLLPVGTPLSLSFQLPNETRLSVRGEVRWVRCASEGNERPGMGVAFRELSPEALLAISEFCAERPPLYIDL